MLHIRQQTQQHGAVGVPERGDSVRPAQVEEPRGAPLMAHQGLHGVMDVHGSPYQLVHLQIRKPGPELHQIPQHGLIKQGAQIQLHHFRAHQRGPLGCKGLDGLRNHLPGNQGLGALGTDLDESVALGRNGPLQGVQELDDQGLRRESQATELPDVGEGPGRRGSCLGVVGWMGHGGCALAGSVREGENQRMGKSRPRVEVGRGNLV